LAYAGTALELINVVTKPVLLSHSFWLRVGRRKDDRILSLYWFQPLMHDERRYVAVIFYPLIDVLRIDLPITHASPPNRVEGPKALYRF
jgi:hypothetical protein